MEDKVKNLKIYLPLIRACAGWSAEDLANRLGVTRSQVSNIETSDRDMTMMQYLAIRQVLDQEMRQSDNEDVRMLADVINVLVDQPEMYTVEQRNQVLADAKLLAPSILAEEQKKRIEARRKASAKWVAALAGSFLAGATAAALAATIAAKNIKK